MLFRRFIHPSLAWCVVPVFVLTNACSRSQPRAGTPAANAANAAGTPSQITDPNVPGESLGTVHVIGTGQRFVLVETPFAQPVPSLADGQALVCRGANAVTATLRVSRERRPPFIVADVAGGEPHVGDEVFIDTTPGHPATPAPAGSPTGTLPPAPTPDFRANPPLPHAR